MFNRTGRNTAKVECSFCTMTIYPGNRARHERACLARIAAQRRRATVRQLEGVGR